MKDLLFSASLAASNSQRGGNRFHSEYYIFIHTAIKVCLRFCILPKLSQCSSVLHCDVNHVFCTRKAKIVLMIFCGKKSCYGCFFFSFFPILVKFGFLFFCFLSHTYSPDSWYIVVMLFRVNGKKKQMKQKRSLYSGSEAQSCSVNCRPHVALFRCVCACVCVCARVWKGGMGGRAEILRVGVFVLKKHVFLRVKTQKKVCMCSCLYARVSCACVCTVCLCTESVLAFSMPSELGITVW